MQITDDVYLVGSGITGLGLTDRYDCNVYLVDGGDGQLALVDAGAGVAGIEYILSNVESHGFRRTDIKALLLTHAHIDHAGGAAELKTKVPSVKVFCHQNEADALRGGNEAFLSITEYRDAKLYPQDTEARPCAVDVEVTDFMDIEVGMCKITAIHTPGHSPGSVCYLFRGKDAMYLMSGDSVMLGGKIFLMNAAGSSLGQYRVGIRKLEGLGLDALLPGHGGFCINNGQEHINRALRAFGRLEPPPNFSF